MTSEEEWKLCIYAADKIANWQDINEATALITVYSPAHIVATVDNSLEAFYNAADAPATASNPISVTVNGSTGGYYYLLDVASNIDCSVDISNYQGPFIESLDIDNYTYSADDDYKLCLLGSDIDGTQSIATEYQWNYDGSSPAISDITIANPDGYYKAGDVITFMVDFTEDITLDSSDSELELGSSGSYDSIGKASYKSNLISNQIIYEYTILDSDNALTIFPAAIILNSSAIKDQAGNPANLDIPASTTASSSSVSIDNVATVVISSLDFNEGDETNARADHNKRKWQWYCWI